MPMSREVARQLLDGLPERVPCGEWFDRLVALAESGELPGLPVEFYRNDAGAITELHVAAIRFCEGSDTL